MLPVSKAASEGGGQSSDPINRMKSLQWSRQAPKLPLMPQDFSMFIRRQYRDFWLNPVPVLSGCRCDALHLWDENQTSQVNGAEILRRVNSGKTSAAEAARLFKRFSDDFTGYC